MFRTACSVLALSLATLAAPALAQPSPPAAVASAQSEDARLAAFFQEAFLESARLSPETLTQLGMKERYGELGDYTEAGQKKTLAVAEAQLARLKREFDRARLSPGSQLSYDLFERNVATQRMFAKWYWQTYAVSSNGSALDGLPVMLVNAHRVDSVADAEAYVARLRAVERVAGEVSDDIDQRTAKGFLPPAFVFGRVIPDARNQIKGAPFDTGPDHALWADFKKKVAALKADDATKTRLLAEGEAALKGEWKRGYERYLTALDAMSRKATTVNGVWALPQGDAFYADMVAFFTTTALTPDQIHQTGLSEVARIRGEMEAIKRKVGFKGTLEEFFAFVKTDPKTHYPNTEAGKQQYLADAKKIIADYMAVADKQFATLPKQALEVRAVEPFREKTASTAFYNPGTPDGSRPGIFYVNLSDMTQVQKVQLPGIAYHEGAPGHHFQIARSQEQTDLADVPSAVLLRRLHRGLGPLRREAGQGSRLLPGPLRRLRPPQPGDLARGAPRGRHRDPFQALEPGPGHRLHARQHPELRPGHRPRDRPLFHQPRPGHQLQGGPAQDLGTAQEGRDRPGPQVRPQGLPRNRPGRRRLPLDVLETRVDAYIAGAK